MLVESVNAHPMRATPCFAATGRWCKQATCWMCCWRPVTVASLLCTRTTCCGLFHDWVVSQVGQGPRCCSTTPMLRCFVGMGAPVLLDTLCRLTSVLWHALSLWLWLQVVAISLLSINPPLYCKKASFSSPGPQPSPPHTLSGLSLPPHPCSLICRQASHRALYSLQVCK